MAMLVAIAGKGTARATPSVVELDEKVDTVIGRGYPVGEAGEEADKGTVVVGIQCKRWRKVSRRHARITHMRGTWRVADIKSNNGVFVNMTKLAQGRTYVLQNGDRVDLGDPVTDSSSATFVFITQGPKAQEPTTFPLIDNDAALDLVAVRIAKLVESHCKLHLGAFADVLLDRLKALGGAPTTTPQSARKASRAQQRFHRLSARRESRPATERLAEDSPSDTDQVLVLDGADQNDHASSSSSSSESVSVSSSGWETAEAALRNHHDGVDGDRKTPSKLEGDAASMTDVSPDPSQSDVATSALFIEQPNGPCRAPDAEPLQSPSTPASNALAQLAATCHDSKGGPDDTAETSARKQVAMEADGGGDNNDAKAGRSDQPRDDMLATEPAPVDHQVVYGPHPRSAFGAEESETGKHAANIQVCDTADAPRTSDTLAESKADQVVDERGDCVVVQGREAGSGGPDGESTGQSHNSNDRPAAGAKIDGDDQGAGEEGASHEEADKEIVAGIEDVGVDEEPKGQGSEDDKEIDEGDGSDKDDGGGSDDDNDVGDEEEEESKAHDEDDQVAERTPGPREKESSPRPESSNESEDEEEEEEEESKGEDREVQRRPAPKRKYMDLFRFKDTSPVSGPVELTPKRPCSPETRSREPSATGARQSAAPASMTSRLASFLSSGSPARNG